MRGHSDIQKTLCDYLLDGLKPDVKKRIDAHLAVCEECTSELKMMRSIMDRIGHSANKPSEDRPSEFWNTFALKVEGRIRRSEQEESQFYPSLRDRLQEVLTFRRRYVVAFSSALSVAVIALILLMFYPRGEQNPAEGQMVRQSEGAMPPSANIHQYFRKSKILLVGLANMKTETGQLIDLEVERKVSRELIYEARYLKNQPLDIRSARLIGDLERILIGIANLKDRHGEPNVEMIRSGIRQENLLFKVRMAEAVHDSLGDMNLRNTF